MRQAMTQATRQAARASGGRPVPADNLHVTLAFLGSVPERRLPELAEVARGAAAATRSALGGADSPDDPLALAFDRLEYWRAAHLLCALPTEPPASVAMLAQKLQELTGPTTSPFRPHVTLARKVNRFARTIGMRPVTWSFTDFVLVDSKTLPAGSIYTVLERFPLSQMSDPN